MAVDRHAGAGGTLIGKGVPHAGPASDSACAAPIRLGGYPSETLELLAMAKVDIVGMYDTDEDGEISRRRTTTCQWQCGLLCS